MLAGQKGGIVGKGCSLLMNKELKQDTKNNYETPKE